MRLWKGGETVSMNTLVGQEGGFWDKYPRGWVIKRIFSGVRDKYPRPIPS
jgi:hypothetical protein